MFPKYILVEDIMEELLLLTPLYNKTFTSKGTETTLLTSRHNDHSSEGFYYWPFMSVHNLGEETTRYGEESSLWKITLWDSVRKCVLKTSGDESTPNTESYTK